MPATNDPLLRILKDINDVRSALRRTTANLPLFDIDNENSPVQITADQNNYVPGNYDVLRLSSDALRSITGIRAGMKGRKLRIFNVGNFAITLVHQSGASLAANRFNFVNSSDFLIPPSGNVLLYYDWTTSRWIGGDQASMYDVVNESTPAQIMADQNDYDPGVSEVLRLSTDAARTISGISGGVKGRYLQIINVGNFNITLPYESALSSPPNRFITPSAENTVLYPRASVRLYYDGVSLRWSIPDRPAWLGQYGISFSAIEGAIQSIPSGVETQVTEWALSVDDWGMYDAVNKKITIPYSGIYIGVFVGTWGANATGYRELTWYLETGGPTVISRQGVPNLGAAVNPWMSCPMAWKFSAGDVVSLACNQDSGGLLNLAPEEWFVARIW